MRRRLFGIGMLWLLLSLPALISGYQLRLPTISMSMSMSMSLTKSPGRSLLSLSPEDSTSLHAALDGTIYLLENNRKRVIWSFSSGPPIYSSYHHPPLPHPQDVSTTSYHIECGDEWDLYMHHQRFGKIKLSMTIDEYISSTPSTTEDGAVTLGSKKTTVFEVDPKTGRLIRTYALTDSLSTWENSDDQSTKCDTNNDLVDSSSTNQNPADLRLQILRTDYILKSYAPSSNQVSWNMTVAEIGAALLCQGVDNSPGGGDLLNSKDKISHEIGSGIALPLPCQSKAAVHRDKNHVLLELPGLERANDQDGMLPGPTPNPLLPVQPKSNVHRDNNCDGMVPRPPMKNNYLGLEDEHNVRIHTNDIFGWSSILSLTLFTGIVVGIVVYRHAPLIIRKVFLHEQPTNSNSKTSSSKKKKSRKFEKSNGTGDGQRIGKLFVSNTEIAKGSNGTIVLEGIYEGRPVAVKRLVQAHHDVAFKEIQNLIASDQHPNIVRWFGVESDQHFVYVSLERCACSLDDLIQIYSDSSQYSASAKDHSIRSTTEYKVRLESVKNIMPDVNFWKANGYPSPLLLKLMRDVVSGLVHLHELGIIHRDLKPQNVLIIKERFLCAKLSDMGISKRLHGDMSSLGHHATGCGSSGWQAPEQLSHGRQTRAVDLFSLGCVLFFCITGGRHPFGDHLERDMNIVKNQIDLFLVEYMPEAVDLISRLLNPDPDLRPKALEVLHHPLFWNSEMRLSFLRDTSDRVELEDRETGSDLLKALESIAPKALGGKWDEKMETAFITNIGHYRRYKFDSVRDLLRVMRNKLNHYRELPKEIQELVGSVPDGFDCYFASRFPRLLIEVYKVICRYCKQEECFQKYFESNVE